MKIIESLGPILQQATNIRINLKKINAFVGSFDKKKLIHWSSASPFNFSQLEDEHKASFLFVFNAISFSYWGEPKWAIDNQYERGTFNMIAALSRAKEKGIPILKSTYLAELTHLEDVLRGTGRIPLLEERERILREVGLIISEKYQGSFLNFVAKAQGDAVDLTKRIVEEFPSFYDSSSYQGREIIFHKRAQLLASDLAHEFRFRKTEALTACADYILPLVLRHKGILEYDANLAFKVDHQIEIPKGSKEEIEIRASTLATIELIKKKLRSNITAMELNDYFWLAGDQVPKEQPYHLTRTTAY